MYRLLAPLLLVLLLASALPLEAQAGMPLFDPDWHIVPDPHDFDEKCPVGAPLGFAGVLVLIQNLMNAAVSLGILISVLVIVFAGVLWILTPTNPENHSKAKKVLMNAVIGLLIILSAWLVVDFIMKTLYDADTSGFGPWNTILIGGEYCIVKNDKVQGLFSRGISAVPGTTGNSYDPRYTTSGVCSPGSVQQAGRSVNTTVKEARFLACIGRPESQCGGDLTNYQWGRGSSAYGPFMILLDSNARYFENDACRAAAGVTGRLNCQDGFTNGNPIPGSAIANRCMRAAANLACSTVAATALVRESGATPWIGNHDSKAAHRRCAQELN